jgi:hypothetical protein
MIIKIYTTSTSQFFEKELDFITETLSQSKGRGDITFEIETIKPLAPQLLVDKDGDSRITWDWFDQTFGDDESDVVCYHFTEYYKKKWGISPRLGGSFNRYNTKQMQFWLVADRNEKAANYDFLEFTRIFLHEVAHGDSRKLLIPNVIHYYDYELQSVTTFFKTVDYRVYNLKKQLLELLKKLYANIKNV